MVQKEFFISDVKDFLRMRDGVTLYDAEINGLIDAALHTLRVAGIKTSDDSNVSPLVSEFVRTYVRVRMLQDASQTFRQSELERENIIIQQLSYGGDQ